MKNKQNLRVFIIHFWFSQICCGQAVGRQNVDESADAYIRGKISCIRGKISWTQGAGSAENRAKNQSLIHVQNPDSD